MGWDWETLLDLHPDDSLAVGDAEEIIKKARAFDEVHHLLNEPNVDWNPGSDYLALIDEIISGVKPVRDALDHNDNCLNQAELIQSEGGVADCICDSDGGKG